MGFLQAVALIGGMNESSGILPYIIPPLDREGKEIRIWLKVEGDLHEPLQIEAVNRVDLADYKTNPDYISKYIYRNRAGAAASWGYSPIHKAGRFTNNQERNQEMLGIMEWENATNTHFYKLKNRLLLDYEKEGFFAPGSVDRIMKGMEEKFEAILDDLDNQQSYIIIFGIEQDGKFLYPGDVPAFLNYFQKKLQENVLSGPSNDEKRIARPCSICGEMVKEGITLDKIFKFSTFDKVSVLPGLDKNEISYSFPVCQPCFEKLTGGRGKIDQMLVNTSVLPDIRIWAVPEAIGGEYETVFNHFLNSWKENFSSEVPGSMGERREEIYFSQLAKGGQGLVFHFVFWERNNAQEILHLMIEDVPPERLARLEAVWQAVCKDTFHWNYQPHLDQAFKSIYRTLSACAGKSKADKKVFRDFALDVIGRMLQGQKLPVDMFKRFVVSRLARLLYENSPEEAKKTMHYTEVWVEYMQVLNREVMI